jgi:transposase
MRTTDGRKLDRGTQEALRIRAIYQIKSGESPEIVAKTLGINRTTVYDWMAKHRDGGLSALKRRKATGRPPKLNGKMIKWIYDLITMKNPQHLKFEFALWTREMIQAAILKKYKVKLSLPSIGRLLGQLGFTVQKPLYKAIQRDESLVKEWLSKVFPKIRTRARAENADIFFGDAAHIRSDHHAGKTWSLRGQTPIVNSTGSRFSFSMISAITSKGQMRFMVVEGGVNSEVFIEFLKRLLVGTKKKIFLILDNGPSHVSKKTKAFVASVAKKLELFYLPPYSPDLNPDELVWNHLKNHTVGRTTVTDKNDFKKKVVGSMRSLQKNPEKIKSFFGKDSLKYAA